MPQSRDRAVMIWLVSFVSLALILVVLGGFVRLTRSGLSIVEWNPIGGAIPPLTRAEWQVEFHKYQQTPEYHQVNRGITLPSYQRIFLVEWVHRLLARLAGLAFAIPFFVLLCKRRIPVREASLYVVMGFLFLSQALLGWLMVASGLVDRPYVSHWLLAAHLFLALSLIALAEWTALGHRFGFGSSTPIGRWSQQSTVALVAAIGLLLQMAYGAFTAGLKAGYISDSWPLMLGRWIPPALLGQIQPPLMNLVAAPLTVAFIHRWLAVIVLAIACVAFYAIGSVALESSTRAALRWIGALSVFQMGLGIAVVTTRVNVAVAILHQANALVLFVLVVFVLHRLRSRDFATARA